MRRVAGAPKAEVVPRPQASKEGLRAGAPRERYFTRTARRAKRAMELLTGLLVGLLLLVVLPVVVGVVCQKIGSTVDARRYPPPGQMVNVGRHRLHICCTGEGSPTVVLDSGLPGSSLSWWFVQPEVAKFTHVCSYDRAGMGWSDAGPMPRTSQQIVEELHTLLTNGGIKGRYVLVGHSFGAFTMRLYASTYPEEVAGIVLVDPLHPSEWLHMTRGQERDHKRAVRLARYSALLARLGIARLVASLVRVQALGIARFLVFLLTGGALKGADRMLAPVERLPSELRPVLRVFWTQPKFFDVLASQVEALPESAAQVAATGAFGSLPLVILSASDPSPTRIMDLDSVARLSSNGKHFVASKSGHWIQLDQPELVVEAIREVVQLTRR